MIIVPQNSDLDLIESQTLRILLAWMWADANLEIQFAEHMRGQEKKD